MNKNAGESVYTKLTSTVLAKLHGLGGRATTDRIADELGLHSSLVLIELNKVCLIQVRPTIGRHNVLVWEVWKPGPEKEVEPFDLMDAVFGYNMFVYGTAHPVHTFAHGVLDPGNRYHRSLMDP